MATITIRSQLDGFKLVERVTNILPKAIEGESRFAQTPSYAGLEAMAQLAALHVRYAHNFERHAFLLKITHCHFPQAEHLDGCYMISAQMRSQSSDTYAYQVKARGPQKTDLNADLLIGTKAFDDHFRIEILQAHYRELFDELMPQT